MDEKRNVCDYCYQTCSTMYGLYGKDGRTYNGHKSCMKKMEREVNESLDIYTYFISFYYWLPDGSTGVGNTSVTCDEIRDIKQIREIERKMKIANNYDKVALSNYIRL